MAWAGRRVGLGLMVTCVLSAAAAAQGTLQVGSYPSNSPYEFKDDAGRFQGFEVELVEAVAARLA